MIAVISKCSSEILSSAILLPLTLSAPSLTFVIAPSEPVVSSPTPKWPIPLHTELPRGVKSKVTVEPLTV